MSVYRLSLTVDRTTRTWPVLSKAQLRQLLKDEPSGWVTIERIEKIYDGFPDELDLERLLNPQGDPNG